MAPQHIEAAKLGLELRQARAKVRAGLRAGTLDISDVVADPPSCIHGLNTSEVVSWTRGMSRIQMEVLNRKALASGINLMVRVERASSLTRTWVALNVVPQRPGKRARLGHGRERFGRRQVP